MEDLERIISWCRGRFVLQAQAGRFPHGRAVYAPTLAFASLAVAAQVVVEKADDGAVIWQLHPRPDEASQKSWVWLLAVRAGYSARKLALLGTLDWQEWKNAVEDDPALECYANAVFGPDIIDLVAYSLDFARCYGTLLRNTCVLGSPQHPADAGAPVRVFRGVDAWFRAGCAGVVLLGDEEENIHWLRQCAGGIVTDDVAHGQALQKKLKRAYDGPQILVAA
ncbi:hypothetical protein [Acidocella sp.]|uniref:hypothetical protein n=1 Tax=Acidocella sp. TaxID=50710 RepID=UPI00260F69FD|nr:hypothetical protein [Acidocella sp.]MDD2794379.1 hypothetical protein [Acidocella sp.]